ncbi:MAG: 3-hydroxyacyl-CoA dehydrogenase family protein [Clostridia bacterium]|nr:3-hydroxyacyl-CoA dehydrogenase family protein [Lachnospiraceae bacterium]NCC00088.1 3-hydroxyacyl-CoA dehydrogenase family protein [Clostridia bacterium]NCD01649.1 3-hydroxyacyl-CoA dehydrogenase family protein [Clostridia bacterium]
MKKIGICGTGLMGASMAQIFAEQGYETWIYGRTDASLSRAEKIIHLGDEHSVNYTTDLEDLKDCEIIIESIVENLDTKQDFFERISKIVMPETILATNTSGLSINKICERVQGKERFLGMHWFNPSNLIPLIEIIRNDETSDGYVQQVYTLAEAIGKKPVICQNDVAGFIANRIQFAVLRECMDIVEKGTATPEDVDKVMKYGLGFRYAAYGPFEVADFGGLDTFYHISEYLNKDLCDEKEPQKLIKDLYEQECYGVKSGRGFYDYSDGRDKEAVSLRDKKFEDMKKLQDSWE